MSVARIICPDLRKLRLLCKLHKIWSVDSQDNQLTKFCAVDSQDNH